MMRCLTQDVVFFVKKLAQEEETAIFFALFSKFLLLFSY